MFLFKQISKIKNPFFVGFSISLIGALPLGYINVIDLQILLSQGTMASIFFILGINVIEFFVLKATIYGAKWIVSQKKLLLFVDWFTVFFLGSIAIFFFNAIGNTSTFSAENLPLLAYPFLLGLFLNTINFIQWPYWSGIYMVLLRNEVLQPTKKDGNLYVIGALVGTFIGMTIFAHVGSYFIWEHQEKFSSYLNLIFACLFLLVFLLQLGKMVWKKNPIQIE